jgi:hypothetical protein
LITEKGETVFYDIFQTGFDNYEFVFSSSYNSDTSIFLNYYVNDAAYTALRLDRKIENDTLIIETNMPTEKQTGVTVAGKPYCFKHKQTAHNSGFPNGN